MQFRAIPEGLISGGEIVFYIFLVGGAFGIVHKTGAFENGVNTAMQILGRFKVLMIPLTMLANPIVNPNIENMSIVNGIISTLNLPNICIAVLTPFSNAPVL